MDRGRLTAPISSVAAADVVMSPDGVRLYVAGEDGKVRVYDVASRSLITTWDVGTRLAGIDVSPDGSFLIVAERQPNGAWGEDGVYRSTSIVYKVSTQSGAVSTFSLAATGNSYNFYDVAVLADGSVLVSQEVYSGWLPLWHLDLSTGGFTASEGTYTTRGRLTRSADATHVLFTPGDISSAPIHLWESGAGLTHSYDSWFDPATGLNAGVQAISLAANRIVQFTAFGSYLYDGDLNFLGTLPLSGMIGSNVSAALFDPTGTYLYLLSDNDDLIYKLATADWSVVRTFDVGGNVGDGWIGGFGNRLQLSPDGRYFTVMTTSGVRLVENDGLDNIFTGTDGPDVLNGGSGDDVVNGGYGDDTAYVTGGTTAADTGRDEVHLGYNLIGPAGGEEAGADHLIVDYSNLTQDAVFSGFGPSFGAAGAQATIQVGGHDRLTFSGVGQMTLTTGSGNDKVYAVSPFDVISTGAGNDSIYGYAANVPGIARIDGGTGIDTAHWVNWQDLEEGILLDLNDPLGVTVGSGESERYLRGIEAVSFFKSGAGDDIIVLHSSGALANWVETWLGSDLVVVHGGATQAVTGTVTVNLGFGAETDTLVALFDQAVETVSFLSSSSSAYVSIGGVQKHSYSEVESIHVETGSADDIVDGRNGTLISHSFVTGAGNDLLYGGAMDDQLQGGIGNDRLDSGDGHDRLYGGSGNDELIGGAGNDWLSVEGAGISTVDGGAGTDTLTVVFVEATTAIVMSAPAADPNGGLAGTVGDGGAHGITYTGIEEFVVLTGFGDDVVRGGPGDDYFNLGAGNDLLHYTGGLDYADGGDGIDGISGVYGAGNSSVIWNLVTPVHGSVGDPYSNFEYFESLTTGAAADIITTARVDADDSVTLGGGNDSVVLWDGRDTVNGGAAGAGATDSGLDTLILNYGLATASVRNLGALVVNGAGASGQIGDGATRLVTFQAFDRFLINTGSGNDDISTGAGNDQIRTGAGADILASGGGNDLLDGGGDADLMTGGQGDDIYVVDNAGDGIVENAGEGNDEVRTTLATFSLVGLNVEKLTATTDIAHDYRGNGADNVITGGAGNDVLRLHDGGDDTALGGAGDDTLFFIGSLTAADVVNGGAGSDTLVVQGPYGALTLTANVTQIEGVAILGGSNTAFGEPGTNRYDYVLTTHDANFAAGVQAFINGGNLLADEDLTFNGSAETDARFVVYGGRGKDTLTGGLGNDIFFFEQDRFSTGDTVNGGAGYDGMFLKGNYTIDFNAPGYTGLFTNIENLTLTSATDVRYSRSGGTEFDYNLTLSNAIVNAGETLTINGALLMANETMVIDGSLEADGHLRLFGSYSDDGLKGGGQSDLILGSLGADTLGGGGGADTFRYDEAADSTSASMDEIIDFTPGSDKIDLSRVDADSGAAGNQAFSWIGSNAFGGSAGQLRAYEQGGTWYVEGDTDGDSVADLVIALTLQGPTALGAGDFFL
jgi:Ca2+-binding RTX toxin-like protein